MESFRQDSILWICFCRVAPRKDGERVLQVLQSLFSELESFLQI